MLEFQQHNITYWALQTVAMMVTVFLLPNLTVKGPIPAFLTVVCLAFVNSRVWDAALFLQMPDTLSVKTGVLLLVNGAIFWIIVKLLPGIEMEGFFPAIAAPVVFTVCSVLISEYGQHVDWNEVYEKVITAAGSLREWIDELQGGQHSDDKKHSLSGLRLLASLHFSRL